MKSTNRDIRRNRRVSTPCHDWLICAPIWCMYGDNIGTLHRTCDAVGACLALPRTAHAKAALHKGNTLGVPHVHWITKNEDHVERRRREWIEAEHASGTRIVAVELADDAVSLNYVVPITERTIMLLGNESAGLPEYVWPYLHQTIEIPMHGKGNSLNVAVAGSLVLYRLAGLI